MSIEKQDLFLLMLHYLGYSNIRNSVFRLRKVQLARFLTFHDISAEENSQFQEQLRFLKEHTNVISLDDYIDGRLSFKRINVVISFDDGYSSWVSRVLPGLKQFGLPASFFISSGFVGLSKEKQTQFALNNLKRPQEISGGLSEDDVRMIAEMGYTIGGHTVNHVSLEDVQDRDELRREIIFDKQKLEDITGTTIKYFSYPFGIHSNPSIELIPILKETGYRAAVTVFPGFNRVDIDCYHLCREICRAAMPIRVLNARICGNYDGVAFLKRSLSKFCRLITNDYQSRI